jgi:hypothetical protein
MLHNAGQDWQVWTIWYDDRLDGRVRSVEREVAYVDVPDELWRQSPAAVNASIAKRIEEHEPSPQPIAPPDPPIDPERTRGPRFSNQKDVEQWLADKPPEWAVVMAARAALRSIPALASEARTAAGNVQIAESSIILPMFRAASATWVAALKDDVPFSAIAFAERAALACVPTNAVLSVSAAISAARASDEATRAAHAASNASASASAAAAMAGNVEAGERVWSVVADDARILEHPIAPNDVAHHPLWPGGFPNWVIESWNQLKHELLLLNSDWEVWTTWYEARLNGGPVPQALEIARVTIAEKIWKQGPRAVNTEIARLISLREAVEPNHRSKLTPPKFEFSIENETTIIILVINYEGEARRIFINALKRSIDKAGFTAVIETIAGEESLVVHLDPMVVPATELAGQIGKLIEHELNSAAEEALKPPDEPLPPPSPAARFTYTNGQFDVAPTSAWRDREAQASVYHARARALATGLMERLSRTDAVPDVAGSVATLLDVLGPSVTGVQPDLLRLASRSITAKARAYSHPAAQWEISADSVSAFFELADVLVDLQTFVRTDLEAHEQAVRELDLTPEKAADAKIALDLVTDAILSAPEVISARAQTAFEAASEVSDTATDRDVKVAVEGDRTLLTANLALAVARELGRDGAIQDRLAPESAAQEGKPAKRQKRARRAKAEADERSWQDFTDRILKRIHQKGPNRIADAGLDALTSVIKHAPKTVAGLAAALALWAISSPIAAGGALASTIAWIGYELRRKNKQSKLQDSTD